MISSEGESLFTLSNTAAAVLTYWFAATVYSFLRYPEPPDSIPWVGYGKGWIAGIQNFLAMTKAKSWFLDGYREYSKKDKSFVIPATLGMGAEIVLPQSQLRWMFDQPDNVLSTSEAHYDALAGDYSFVEPVILKDPYHEHVIHKNLVRNLNTIIPQIEYEVPSAVTLTYGNDTKNFKKLDCLQSFMDIVPTLSNRLLVGTPLCRNRQFVDAVVAFTVDAIRNQYILSLAPAAIRGILGHLLGLVSTYHYRQSAKHTMPLIKQRISDIKKKDSGDPAYKDWTPPNDFVTWSYLTAMAEGRYDEADPVRISQRIMPLNFAANHTTSITAYDTLTNILHADPDVLRSLRSEAYEVMKEGGFTKQNLGRMHRMDSVIRESQRFAPLSLTFSMRKVVAKEGVVTPEGVHVKQGTVLSCPWGSIAFDEEIIERANEFDAFRYSREREKFEAMTAEQKAEVDALKLKQTGLVTTAMHHLPFGHGRHAW